MGRFLNSIQFQYVMVNINIIIEDEGKEGFSVFSPDINVISNGKSINEAKKNFVEALQFHLECAPDEIEKLKQETSCLITTLSITNPLEKSQLHAQ